MHFAYCKLKWLRAAECELEGCRKRACWRCISHEHSGEVDDLEVDGVADSKERSGSALDQDLILVNVVARARWIFFVASLRISVSSFLEGSTQAPNPKRLAANS